MNNNKMKACKKISHKNIRATAFKEFWGTEFEESIYLWEGAKHNLTLSEIDEISCPTMTDLFAEKEDNAYAHQFCKKLYSKFLPILSLKLNEIHGTTLPVTFWRTVFGYWLFRHICIIYEKYSYLSRIDINKTSIKLLEKNSFYIPNNHYDYTYCFCNDFGVQQLVSLYYSLFKNKDFPSISKKFVLNKENHKSAIRYYLSLTKKKIKELIINYSRKEINPQIALLDVFFTANVIKMLSATSKGLIRPINLPRVVDPVENPSNDMRNSLLCIEAENEFEYYLIQSLYHCVPMMIIEQFRKHYDSYLMDIEKKSFTHIVSEAWISNLPTSIYAAIAKNNGRKLICHQHGASIQWLSNNLKWIDYSVADAYLTTGWKMNWAKIVQGGFCCRDIKPYNVEPWKKDILFVTFTSFPYLMDFGKLPVNSNFIKALKSVREFVDSLPEGLREYFVLRHRRAENFWDTEHSLSGNEKNIKIDKGNFAQSLTRAKIVVIDHLSTGVAEILLMNVPCLIIHNNEIVPLSDEFTKVLNDLIDCGVVHNSSQSAVEWLSNLYDDVPKWWNSEAVKVAVNKLISKTLAPPSKTIDYLLSCLHQ